MAKPITQPIDYDDWYDKVYGPGNANIATPAVLRSQDSFTHSAINGTTALDMSSRNTRHLVKDDEILFFDDGFQITGKELGTLLKIAKKLGMKEYPEDFL